MPRKKPLDKLKDAAGLAVGTVKAPVTVGQKAVEHVVGQAVGTVATVTEKVVGRRSRAGAKKAPAPRPVAVPQETPGKTGGDPLGSAPAVKAAAKKAAKKAPATTAPAKKAPAKKTAVPDPALATTSSPARKTAVPDPAVGAESAPAATSPATKTAAKTAAKKAPATKATAKKAPATKKVAAKKAPAKKAATKKVADTPAAEVTPADIAPAKKAAKKAPAKKAPAKKAPAKKASAQKTAAKKTAAPPADPTGDRPLTAAELVADERDEVTTPVGTTGAAPASNPDTTDHDLQQVGTEPLVDPSLTKAVASEAEMMSRASDPAPTSDAADGSGPEDGTRSDGEGGAS